MTTPLRCLVILAFLPYPIAWVAGFLRHRQFGSLDNKHPRQQQAQLEGPGARAQAAHANAWEALAVFTAAVVVTHLANADADRAARLSQWFVATRILHPILYVANLDVLRSIVFVGGLGCLVGLFGLAF